MTKTEAIEFIKSGIGNPIITGLEISDEDIERLHLNKALNEFFKRYPLKYTENYHQSTTLKKEDLPGGENNLGILNVNFTPSAEMVDPNLNDPFGLARRIVDLGNITYARPENLAQLTAINSLRRPPYSVQHNEVDDSYLFSSWYDGNFRVTWAIKGDIENVKERRLYDVLDLGVAYLKIYIGNTRGMLKFPGPVQFNADTLKNDGYKERDEILDKWVIIPEALLWR